MGTVQKLLFTLLLCSSIVPLLVTGSEGSSNHHHHHHHHGHHHHHHHHGHHHKGGDSGLKKLFVFGDSYADTGNSRLSISNSWKAPYGITFPGKPSGRFSDGRVSTDFLARYLGLNSPLPYRWRKYSSQNSNGINFAFGGTGVFDTTAPYPNMTTQIDFFQKLVNDKIITPLDLQNSIALVSVAGNDYSAYLSRGGSFEGLPIFIQKVVNQLAINLHRIYNLGVKKIVVPILQPLGCLPQSTLSNWFQQCNATSNQAVALHNLLLQQAIAKFSNQTHVHASSFIILDLYNAFMSVLEQKGAQQGSLRFDNPLKPCCMGVNQNYSCGSIDAWGNKMYTVCQNPKSSFFWDSVHPTDAGWHAIYLALRANLEELHTS